MKKKMTVFYSETTGEIKEIADFETDIESYYDPTGFVVVDSNDKIFEQKDNFIYKNGLIVAKDNREQELQDKIDELEERLAKEGLSGYNA